MEIITEGQGELIGWHDPDENRAWIQANKCRDLRDKRLSVKEAVEREVKTTTAPADSERAQLRAIDPAGMVIGQ